MDYLKPAAAGLVEQALYKAAETMRRKHRALALRVGEAMLEGCAPPDLDAVQREANTLRDAEKHLRSIIVI
jgi:hypothetical protein